MLGDATDFWIKVGAWAAVITSLPAVWATFYFLRSIVRKIKAKWDRFKQRIRDEAVAAANHEREIQEGLKQAAKEAKEREIEHAKRDAQAAQQATMLLELRNQVDSLLKPQTEAIVATVKEESNKAISSSGDAKREVAELKTGMDRLQTTVEKLEEKAEASEIWQTDHEKNDERRFDAHDAILKRIETGVKNGNGHETEG